MDPQDNILTDIVPPQEEASRTQKVLSNIIDFIIQMAVIVAFYLMISEEFLEYLSSNKPFSTYLVVFVLLTLYRLLFLLILQRTIGMMICRIKYLNEDFQPLSLKERAVASIGGSNKKIRKYKV